tara:strand:+ start:117 stop:1073 length:957 start_codon:yes stop_codon:yes gene_type:complete
MALNALIFGCTGQDGSYLTKSLLKQGKTVVGVSRAKTINKSKHARLGIKDEINIIRIKPNNVDAIARILEKEKPDEIYNLGAQSSVGKSFFDPIDTTESIINGTLSILEVSKKLNYEGRLFFAGSSEIFGETPASADVNHIQNPKSPYAIAKQASYNLVKLYREAYKLNCVTGILFNHESPLRDKNFVTQKIITGALKCSIDRSFKFTLGNINIARDWGWAEEYVEAIQEINRAKRIKDHVICTGQLTTLKEIIEIAFGKFDLNWQDHIILDKNLIRSKDIMRSCGDPSRLKADLNWEAKVHVGEIIENLIQSEISNL